MSDAFKLISDVLTSENQAILPCAWEDLLGALHEITLAGPTKEVEELLVAALGFEGRFSLTPTSSRPHRLSPEDMVKSLAIQALGRWGAAEYIPDIERIESTARSPGLASVARSTIQRLRRVPEQFTRVEGLPGTPNLQSALGGVAQREGSGLPDSRGGENRAGAGRLSGLAQDLASLGEPVAEPLPSNPQAVRRLQEAAVAYMAKDYDRALALLRRWGRYLPAAQLAYLRGSICYGVEEYAAAARFYRRAAKLDPGNANYTRLYLVALGKSDSDGADVLARQILAEAERHHPGLVVTAGAKQLESLRGMDDRVSQPAYEELSRIIEIALARLRSGEGEGSAQDSTQAMALAILGFCRDHLGDAEGALRYYDDGLAAFPSNDALLVARGILRYGTDTPAAILDFHMAIQLGSPVVWPFFFLAHHLLVNSRARECLTTCEQALRFQASDAVLANLHEWVAISRSDLGFPASEVRAAFDEAIRLDPANERIRRNHRAFEEGFRLDALDLRVWQKPEESDVRAYGRTEYRPAIAA